MGTTNKSEKPTKDQVDAPEAAEVIEDAEIVEELAPDQRMQDSNDTGDDLSDADHAESEEPTAEDEAAEDIAALDQDDPAEEPQDDAAPESEDEAQAGEEPAATEDTPEDLLEDEPAADTQMPEETFAPAAAPPVQQVQKRGGFVPMVFGGIVAAAIGFGGAVYYGDQLGLGTDTKTALAEITAQLEAQNATLAELDGKSAAGSDLAASAQRTAEAAAADLRSLRATLESQSAELSTLSEAVASFEARLTDIEKRPLSEGLGAAAIAAYEREVKDLKALVAAQKAEAAELKDRADLSAKTALARSSAARIVAALESGASYRGALVDLRSATGQEAPAVLAQFADEGLITLGALSESYPDAARAALAKARADKVDEGQGNMLGNFFKTQLGVRSVTAREGTDTDAILSRAEAALKAGDLTAALGEIDTLAEGPKSVMAEWVALAQTRAEATQAADDLAQTLNSN